MRVWQLKALLPTMLAVVVVLSAGPATAKQRQSLQPYSTLIFTSGKISLGMGLGLLPGLVSCGPTAILGLVVSTIRVTEFVIKGVTTILEQPSNSRQDELAMFEELSNRLNEMDLGTQGIETTLRGMTRSLPYMLSWGVMLDSLEDYTRPINSLHKQFTLYQKYRHNFEEHTLRNFAESVVNHGSTSIRILMANVHSMVEPENQILEQLGPEYLMVKSLVNQNYQNHLRQLMLKHKKDGTLRRLSKREANDEIGELSLRPSIFLMLEKVLKNNLQEAKMGEAS